jgi:hypothetical protein
LIIKISSVDKAAQIAKEAANRWTGTSKRMADTLSSRLLTSKHYFIDNVFSIQSHCADKFGIDKTEFNRNFGISDDFDNIA